MKYSKIESEEINGDQLKSILTHLKNTRDKFSSLEWTKLPIKYTSIKGGVEFNIEIIDKRKKFDNEQ